MLVITHYGTYVVPQATPLTDEENTLYLEAILTVAPTTSTTTSTKKGR